MTEPNKSLTEALKRYEELARQNAQALRAGAAQLRERAKAERAQADADDAQAKKLDESALEEVARLDRLRGDLAPLAAGKECSPCEEAARKREAEKAAALEAEKKLVGARDAQLAEARRALEAAGVPVPGGAKGDTPS